MSKPVSVLIIDDESSILSALKRLLLHEPFDILTTVHPFEAMDILSKNPIKVVISDQRMPVVSGVQFLKEVKDSYPEIIRILLTGHADMQAAEAAVNVGQIYRFLTKPWDPEELQRTVRQAIDRYDLASERRQLFEQLDAKNKEFIDANNKLHRLYEKQKEFTSTVSHELRTPLASIKMAIDIVMSGTPGVMNQDQLSFLGKAKSNVDRLNRLINDILDLSKLEAGKLEMRLVPGDLNTALLESIDSQRLVAENKKLALTADLQSEMPEVMFDKDRLAQVMSNLLSNALKFTEQGGVVVKSVVVAQRNSVEISVEDTGPGIKAEDLSRLFEKFQQLESSAYNKSGGTGLGLAISKMIVEKHGGKIWAESEYGKGTKVIFLLPIVERRKGE